MSTTVKYCPISPRQQLHPRKCLFQGERGTSMCFHVAHRNHLITFAQLYIINKEENTSRPEPISLVLKKQIFLLSCAEVASLKRITEAVCVVVIPSLCTVFISDRYTILHWLKTHMYNKTKYISEPCATELESACSLHCVFTLCLLPGYSHGQFWINHLDLLLICWLLLKSGHMFIWLRYPFLFS